MATAAVREERTPVPISWYRVHGWKTPKLVLETSMRAKSRTGTGTRARSDAATGSGNIVGPYRILERLGNGGSAEVFKVEHTVTRRQEALKVLREHAWSNSEEQQRYLREVQVHASLNHPNIAAVYNSFWDNGDLILVMELASGESLRTLIERGPIPLNAGLRYICDLLRALSYAHANGVVHRDIKPANIIVADDNSVKLIDFGLAKSPADPHVTQAVTGSMYYVSPEQVQGVSAADPRSDIYSLGVVLYEIVTGQRPFESDSTFSLMMEHVQKDPTPPGEIVPSIPAELNQIILTALAKKPSARFQSADDFFEALDRVAKQIEEEFAIEAAPESPLDEQPAKPQPTMRFRLPAVRIRLRADVMPGLRVAVEVLAKMAALTTTSGSIPRKAKVQSICGDAPALSQSFQQVFCPAGARMTHISHPGSTPSHAGIVESH
jgi:serine/threonine protein kinase